MCSWTAVGSEDPKMLSSSSLEMKKNLGKACFLLPRWSDKSFWLLSKSLDKAFKSFLEVYSMSFLKFLSMRSNFLAASGSCIRMS